MRQLGWQAGRSIGLLRSHQDVKKLRKTLRQVLPVFCSALLKALDGHLPTNRSLACDSFLFFGFFLFCFWCLSLRAGFIVIQSHQSDSQGPTYNQGLRRAPHSSALFIHLLLTSWPNDRADSSSQSLLVHPGGHLHADWTWLLQRHWHVFAFVILPNHVCQPVSSSYGSLPPASLQDASLTELFVCLRMSNLICIMPN